MIRHYIRWKIGYSPIKFTFESLRLKFILMGHIAYAVDTTCTDAIHSSLLLILIPHTSHCKARVCTSTYNINALSAILYVYDREETSHYQQLSWLQFLTTRTAFVYQAFSTMYSWTSPVRVRLSGIRLKEIHLTGMTRKEQNSSYNIHIL